MATSLISELKRRNVIKVCIAYLLMAWVVIQVSQAAVPALHLPEWINTAVFFFCLIGLGYFIYESRFDENRQQTTNSSTLGPSIAARTSSLKFKATDSDITEIGKALKVKTVLEGSIRKSGDQIRVTAQLINVEDGYHLWSETYDRELKNIFKVQDQIAQEFMMIPWQLAFSLNRLLKSTLALFKIHHSRAGDPFAVGQITGLYQRLGDSQKSDYWMKQAGQARLISNH